MESVNQELGKTPATTRLDDLTPLLEIIARYANSPRHELKKREQKMRLYREVEIGRLDEISFSDPADLIGHPLHIFEFADVLDERIGIDHIEIAVRKLAKISRIGEHGLDVRVCRWDGIDIDERNADSGIVGKPDCLPDLFGAADVQNGERPWQIRDQAREPLITPQTKPRCQRCRIAIVSNLEQHWDTQRVT
jgi:hypothetical protein